MAKLYFRYGTVCSAKTLNLLAVAHNYEMQGKRCVIVKPSIDTRYPDVVVGSRSGLSARAHLVLGTAFPEGFPGMGTACILVDEAQFLASDHVDHLHELAHLENVPVICYGLRTDFKRQLFPGSKRLLELADSIEEVKTTCFYCNRKATFNQRRVPGDAQVLIGGDDVYRPVCALHYGPGEPHGQAKEADRG